MIDAAQNIWLAGPPQQGRWGRIDRKRMYARAGELLRRLGVACDLGRPIRELSIAQQQMVEIAKALAAQARILILDEPTSALTGAETAKLFAILMDLKARGAGIVYVSHRLEEIAVIGDRVTILRDGVRVATVPARDTPVSELVRLMVGRDIRTYFPGRTQAPAAEVPRVEDVRRAGVLHGISLSVRRGEILGIAGLVGAGRTELLRALFGADRRDTGRVLIHGREVRIGSPAEAVARGLGLIAEDRKHQGLVLSMSVQANIALAGAGWTSAWGIIDRRTRDADARRWVEALRIRTPDIHRQVRWLSGGNQQKTIIARWLCTDAHVLLFDEPTRGIDVAGRVEIYECMNALAQRGMAIIMVSSDLDEVLGLSDRILVMHAGRITGMFSREEGTREAVMWCAMGRARGTPH